MAGMTPDTAAAKDTCDRCKKSVPITVGHEQEYGYDGLCDPCIDALAEAKHNDGSNNRWEVTVSFQADRERDAQQVVQELSELISGGYHDVEVRDFTLRAVEYLDDI